MRSEKLMMLINSLHGKVSDHYYCLSVLNDIQLLYIHRECLCRITIREPKQDIMVKSMQIIYGILLITDYKFICIYLFFLFLLLCLFYQINSFLCIFYYLLSVLLFLPGRFKKTPTKRCFYIPNGFIDPSEGCTL